MMNILFGGWECLPSEIEASYELCNCGGTKE